MIQPTRRESGQHETGTETKLFAGCMSHEQHADDHDANRWCDHSMCMSMDVTEVNGQLVAVAMNWRRELTSSRFQFFVALRLGCRPHAPVKPCCPCRIRQLQQLPKPASLQAICHQPQLSTWYCRDWWRCRECGIRRAVPINLGLSLR
jgi:hypothetical protein